MSSGDKQRTSILEGVSKQDIRAAVLRSMSSEVAMAWSVFQATIITVGMHKVSYFDMAAGDWNVFTQTLAWFQTKEKLTAAQCEAIRCLWEVEKEDREKTRAKNEA